MDGLDNIREQISSLDQNLVALIAKRLKLTNSVVEEKIKSRKSLIDYEREEVVLKRVEEIAISEGLDPSIVRKIYSDIIFLSRNNQVGKFAEANPLGDTIKIGFQGELGAFSHLAIINHYRNVEVIPKTTFRDVFDALELNEVDLIMVPVENSVEGTVRPVYDLLLDRSVITIQEVVQKIEHMLIGFKGQKIENVYSHPQALAQCSMYLAQNNLFGIPVADTAGAVKMLKNKRLLDSGAIASRQAAEIYDMEILEENIENSSDNFTRFFLATRIEKLNKAKRIVQIDPSKKYKTSLIFGVHDRSGSLLDVLQLVAKFNINMTKLESRPSRKKPWDYTFYVDFEGHQNDKFVRQMLVEIQDITTFMQVLGSYSTIS